VKLALEDIFLGQMESPRHSLPIASDSTHLDILNSSLVEIDHFRQVLSKMSGFQARPLDTNSRLPTLTGLSWQHGRSRPSQMAP